MLVSGVVVCCYTVASVLLVVAWHCYVFLSILSDLYHVAIGRVLPGYCYVVANVLSTLFFP